MSKFLFLLGYSIKRPEVLKSFKEIKKNEKMDTLSLKKYQDKKLQDLIKHAVREVPYYKNLFQELNLKPDDIQGVEDLIKIPILTKEMIKKNPEDFIAKNYTKNALNGSTGGSTGVPLKYLMSNKDYSKGVALLFRGFQFGGYRLGDSLSVIAGSSLVSNKKSFKTKFQDWVMNFHHYSSYGMKDEDLLSYYKHLNKKRPLFLRGYASSLFLLAKYLEENNLSLNYKLKAIFSTSEKLMSHQRETIERVFNTEVFDNYGVNDGGISAYECKYHNGMHIDYERSILEITNDTGKEQLKDNQGKMLATSLFNYAMPFIRYDTGDLGVLSSSPCPCGCSRPLLKEISGRVTDYLKLNEVYIGSPVLTVLMGKVDVENYQIIQTTKNSLQISMIKGKTYTAKDEKFIYNSLQKNVGKVDISFNYLSRMNEFKTTNNSKHKFIINEVCK